MNKCIQCGSTSYKPIIKRDAQGVMRPSGEFQCTGCSLIFSSIDAWRMGDTGRGETPKSDESVPLSPPTPA